MNQNTKNLIKYAIGAVVVILLIWLASSCNKQQVVAPDLTDSTNTISNVSTTLETVTSTPTTTINNTKKIYRSKKIINVSKLSYGELMEKYSGYSFQFSANCTIINPSSFVIKKGQTFAIDNRENKTHYFSFDQQKFTVEPYSYAIVLAENAGDFSVFCDGAQRSKVTVYP